jgi:microcystin-dependent protein
MAISNNSTGLRPGVCTSTTRPSNPYIGQLVFETDTFVLKYWTGSVWQGAVSAPAGTMDLYAGSTAPTGWLLAYGQAVSRTTYADLFAVLSTTYNIGGEAGTDFRIPDMRGRVPAGLDNMGGTAASRLTATVLSTANALGATGGTQTHIMTTAEMPSHTHTQNAHGHTVRGEAQTYPGNALLPYLQPYYNLVGVADSRAIIDTTATNQNTGGGSAHLNTQPTIVLNYIIKF